MSLFIDHKTNDISVIGGGAPTLGGSPAGGGGMWTEVANVTEFQNAISNGDTKIFLKNGNYVLTQALDLYDNLTLVGENLPDDQPNTGSTGVKISHALATYTIGNPYTTPVIESCTNQPRGLDIITCNSLSAQIPAGSIIMMNNMVNKVSKTANAGATTLYLSDTTVKDTGTSISVFTNPIKNIHLENIMIEGSDGSNNPLYLRHVDGVKLKNVYATSLNTVPGVAPCRIEYSYNIDIDTFYTLSTRTQSAIFRCNHINVKNFFRGDDNQDWDNRLTFVYCSNFYADNINVGVGASTCSDFTVRNCSMFLDENFGGNIYYFTTCQYFTLEGLKSNVVTTSGYYNFDVSYSSNFSVFGCYAPDSSAGKLRTNFATSNYQIFGNSWQNQVLSFGKYSEATESITASASILFDLNIPVGARLLGVRWRVDSDMAIGDNFDISYTPLLTSIASNVGITKNTKGHMFFDMNTSTPILSAQQDVELSRNAGGSFTAQGSVTVGVFYEEIYDLDDVL